MRRSLSAGYHPDYTRFYSRPHGPDPTQPDRLIMRKDARPAKPYRDFPLFAHASGQWAKKVRGRLRYFGVWADPDAALQRWVDERDDLLAGRIPRARRPGGKTVADLVNGFLAAKRERVDAGELSPRMWSDYHEVCERVVEALGRGREAADVRAEDFGQLRAAAAERLGPVSLGVFIQRVRTLFRWGYESGLLDVPVRYGEGFAKPTRRVVRRARARAGPRLLSAVRVRKLVRAAGQPLRAMVLLGINCGFGQSDCAELPRSALDLAGGWATFPRPKTGVGRRCPLWPETVAALRDALRSRPEPRDPAHADRVFLTKYGQPWVRFTDRGGERRGTRSDSVSMEFRKLVKRAGVKVPGGFYTLRHTFRTVADEVKDPPAIDAVMGHHDASIRGTYRQSIGDARLRAVADHVRRWLGFGP